MFYTRKTLRMLTAAGLAVALLALIHPLLTRLTINHTVNRALPGLPEQFRADLESSMMTAPLVGPMDTVELRLLQFIQYPYLGIDRLHAKAFDNEVQHRLFLAQDRQSLPQKRVSFGALPLSDINSLRKDTLWELGQAMYAAWKTPDGQQYLETLKPPAELTADEDSSVKLVRTAFWAAYGSDALRQAVHGS
jgi:hypothetical protein